MIKKYLLNQNISTKLLIYTFLFSVVVTLVFTGIKLYKEYVKGYERIEHEFLQIESSYLDEISHSGWVYDAEELSLDMKGIVNMQDIKYSEVRFKDGTVFKEGSMGKGKEVKKEFDIVYTHNNKDIKLGMLLVVGDVEGLHKRLLDHVIITLFSQLVETFLAVLFILFIFRRLLTRHLLDIAQYTKSLDFKESKQLLVLDKELSTTHKDELDEVVYSINMMQEKLYDSYNELSKELNKREEVEKSLIKSKNRLEDIYLNDTLTGLGNRHKLLQDLELFQTEALVIIDIDDFKEINDFYGHLIGDNVIVECSYRIEEYVDTNLCTVYRLHSDKFAITYESISSKEEFEEEVKLLIQRVTREMISIDQYEILIHVTAGIAISVTDFYKDTNLALKIAKKFNKNFVVYDKKYEIEKEYEKNLKWTKKLKKALDDGRITAFFQPIYNQKTKKVDKCEALVRMIDEDGEIISPFFFLGVSIKSKLYPKITMTMIDKVVEAAKVYDYTFSINFTIDDVLNPEVRDYFEKAIKENNLKDRIVVELVESENIENFDEISSYILKIKDLGCQIAIDDFGTGYSNFEYLLKLNADYVKIDGSLIKNIDKDKDMLLVAENIVNFAKIAKMKTIAEFVCSKEIRDILRDIDVDYLQGYYISEPLAFEDMYKIKNIE
ncbi:EAL domain-containing protein [Sulfurimonas sp. SAG-AH-194-C21]|nr:EAL domain-containing protein [Sulfurimonas sp. SAG-AH-194-C21]MDF1883187.1 EAL domain-containing protein [Sulfurimonas sp. SAG-AH-194-C21]